MANPDETFDPNDLESIDALLDEAELEAVSDDMGGAELEDDSSLEDSVAQLSDLDVNPDDQSIQPDAGDFDNAVDGSDDLLDSLDDLVADTEQDRDVVESAEEKLASDPEPEVIGVSEPVRNPQPDTKANARAAVESETDVDDFLEKRAAAKATKNSNFSVEDMDSIKKLIIIFGSVLSVLALTGIGIGVWSALAAGSAGVDDETKTLIESIKASSEMNGSAIRDNDKLTKSVEKKLDAINYQLEQMVADLATIEPGSSSAKQDVIDPLGLGAEKTTAQPGHSEQASVVTNNTTTSVSEHTVMAQQDPELMKKISSVSSRLYVAQKRIDEVNKRIKAMQAQSSALIQSMKMIEKEALVAQAAREEKRKAMEEKAKKSQANPYQYSAPDGGFYDQSVMDSYP